MPTRGILAHAITAFDGANMMHDLPKGNCPTYRPQLIPPAACPGQVDVDAAKLVPSTKWSSKTRPPSCCENARRAEAAMKHLDDLISSSLLLRMFEPGFWSSLFGGAGDVEEGNVMPDTESHHHSGEAAQMEAQVQGVLANPSSISPFAASGTPGVAPAAGVPGAAAAMPAAAPTQALASTPGLAPTPAPAAAGFF
mmetsp:Transcript_50102/g.119224  ORF Transcript_50102/g.119224 Transcript_50102/m.119224 type:complete len:196 (+) Transcript_50102:132-719(+)